MSQPSMRIVFASLKSSRLHTPETFFRQCRAKCSSTPQHVHYTTRAHRSKPPQRHYNITSVQHDTTRLFSTISSWRSTVVKLNPRADDDGNDMTIEISDKAAKASRIKATIVPRSLTSFQRLRQITNAPQKRNSLASSSTPESHLRVTVTSGGCHGFQYLMSLESAEKIDKEEDTIFVSGEDAGEGHAEVVMDAASLELLKGSTIDYTTELIGSQFKITGNPRAKSSCGCGTSFDIE